MAVAGPAFRLRAGLRLAEGEVQVWRTDLDAFAAYEVYCFGLLSTDEQNRAQRFRFPVHRSRFTVARGLLRTLLGSYLDTEPREVRFLYSDKDKPRLDDGFSQSRLQFNISHSDNVALLAFTLGRDIGVDVERVRLNFDVQEIAQRFFSPVEQNALAALPAAQKHQGFFNCWTRKEAFVKAEGQGLSLPLDQFDVSLAPGEPAGLLATRPDAEEKARWFLVALDAGPDCAAAVVVKGGKLHVTTAAVSSVLESGT